MTIIKFDSTTAARIAAADLRREYPGARVTADGDSVLIRPGVLMRIRAALGL